MQCNRCTSTLPKAVHAEAFDSQGLHICSRRQYGFSAPDEGCSVSLAARGLLGGRGP